MDALLLILVLASLLAAGYGFFELREINAGVGFIGIAALFGIYARLAQAAMHQNTAHRSREHLATWIVNELIEAERSDRAVSQYKEPRSAKEPTRQELARAAEMKKKREQGQ